MLTPDKSKRGGWRGGGRPKKRPSELQRIRSIRATDKDWLEIRKILPVIKNRSHAAGKKVCVFILSKEEEASVNTLLIQGLIERRRSSLDKSTIKLLGHEDIKQDDVLQEETPSVRQKALVAAQEGYDVTIPAEPAVGEDEAMEAFRMFYRLNPVQAASMAKAGLDKERRIAAARAKREEEKKIMDSLEDRIQKAFLAADSANSAIEAVLSSKEMCGLS